VDVNWEFLRTLFSYFKKLLAMLQKILAISAETGNYFSMNIISLQ